MARSTALLLGVFAAMVTSMATTPSKAVNLFASVYNGTVDTLTLTSTSSGKRSLTRTASAVACGESPSWLTLDPQQQTLYCSNEANSPNGSLTAFAYSSTGELSQKAVATTIGGDVNSQLYGGAHGDGFIAIAEYETSSISTFALPISDTSKALQSWTYHLSHPGPNPARQDAPHPHQVILDPTGNFILSPDLGSDVVRVFHIDNQTGILMPAGNLTAPPGSGPRHASFFVPSGDPSKGAVMYLASELANTVTSYAICYPAAGRLEFEKLQGPVHPYPHGVPPSKVSSAVGEIRVRDRTVTVSNRGDESFGPNEDSLAVFSLAPNGTFNFQNIYPAGGSYPRTFTFNSAGDLVATGLQYSHAVAVLQRDVRTGAIGGIVGKVVLDSNVSSVVWDEPNFNQ